MNYEAKIDDRWYPVEIEGEGVFRGIKVINVYIKGFLNGVGERSIPMNRSRCVLPQNIRETTDDPLETVYPKEK